MKGEEFVSDIYAKREKKNSSGCFNSLSENDLNQLLQSLDVVKGVNDLGFSSSEINKMVLRERLETTGFPFLTFHECVEMTQKKIMEEEEKKKKKKKEEEEKEEEEEKKNRNKKKKNKNKKKKKKETEEEKDDEVKDDEQQQQQQQQQQQETNVDHELDEIFSKFKRKRKNIDISSQQQQLSPSELLKQFLCKVCMDSCIEIVYIPCYHMCVCSKCTTQISNCPICRDEITYIIKAIII